MGKLIIKINDNVNSVYCDDKQMLYDKKEKQFYCETINGKHKIKIIKNTEKVNRIRIFTTSLRFKITNHLFSIQNNIRNYEYKIDVITYRENSLLFFNKEVFSNVNFLGVQGEVYTLKNTLNSNITIENILYNNGVQKTSKFFLTNLFFTLFITILELCLPTILFVYDILEQNEVVFRGLIGKESAFLSLFMIIIIFIELFSSVIKSFYYKKHYNTFYKIID